jgi:SAM-dependent methyltransferase
MGTLRVVTFDDVRRDWTELGEQDPLWAVYVAPGTRGGRWDVEEFFATGRAEVDQSLQHLTSLGLVTGTTDALDFGAGVGRLSNALAAHFDRVTGVDVSPTMLEQARRLDRSQGRITFHLNDKPHLGDFADESVDLVYSSLVLQHLPRDLAETYLREFVRLLRPGGVAVVQVVSAPTRSLKGLIARYAPFPLVAWGQKRLLGYPAPMRMTPMPPATVEAVLRGTGARIVDAVPDPSYGGHWKCVRYYLSRSSA